MKNKKYITQECVIVASGENSGGRSEGLKSGGGTQEMELGMQLNIHDCTKQSRHNCIHVLFGRTLRYSINIVL